MNVGVENDFRVNNSNTPLQSLLEIAIFCFSKLRQAFLNTPLIK